MNDNFFLLLKGTIATATRGDYDIDTGAFIPGSATENRFCLESTLSGMRPPGRPNIPCVFMAAPDVAFSYFRVFYYDKNMKYLGTMENHDTERIIYDWMSIDESRKKAVYLKCSFSLNNLPTEAMTDDDYEAMLTRVWIYVGYGVQQPSYKKVEKKYTKETNQMFLRESLEGTIKFVGHDYEFISSQDVETKFLLVVAHNYSEYRTVYITPISVNSFTKLDCTFNRTLCSAQPKLTAIDRYSRLMDKYENTYDLIKLAPAITPIKLTKRLLYQFYIQGSSSITCYANGTYWEQDVNEVIDSEDDLKSKYYFYKYDPFQEINISEAQAGAFAGVYMRDTSYTEGSGYRWVNASNPNQKLTMTGLSDAQKAKYNTSRALLGTIYNPATMKAETHINGESADTVYYLTLSDDTETSGAAFPFTSTIFLCPTYTHPGVTKFTGIFGTANPCIMTRPSQFLPQQFDFSECTINYTVWGRILADVDSITQSSGTTTLYDLPSDDFVTERVNYRKCIGLKGATVIWSGNKVDYPTKYGLYENNSYFTSNVVDASTFSAYRPAPISRSSWAGVSVWLVIPTAWSAFEPLFRKEFTIKDAYALADVIKALLRKIDPLISFEATSDYSQFFYGNVTRVFPSDTRRSTTYVPFIIPKSNVLKGNYDQAAQKAEITLQQVMDMLRDCFRCYWYIDSGNRLRIEHIKYFMNGGSYEDARLQVDLTQKFDKFNKKLVLYAQEETSYEKEDLCGRYEFSWTDESTDEFEDLAIDMKSVYVQTDKSEQICPDGFSTDIDLMLYAPDKFSEDGFALVMAHKTNHVVPISSVYDLRDDEYEETYKVDAQNYLCSWLYLARYYMLDMPAYNIEYTRAPKDDYDAGYEVRGLKQSMQQEVKFQTGSLPDTTKAIKTSIGIGTIDSASVNLDTMMISATLNFELDL